MIKRSKYLALATEPFEDEVGVHPAFDKLDRDRLVKFAVGTLGAVNGAHAATANFLFEDVYTDAATYNRIILVL